MYILYRIYNSGCFGAVLWIVAVLFGTLLIIHGGI